MARLLKVKNCDIISVVEWYEAGVLGEKGDESHTNCKELLACYLFFGGVSVSFCTKGRGAPTLTHTSANNSQFLQ